MNDLGSIPQATKLPQVVITLRPTGVPGQNQLSVNHYNIDGWESVLALMIEALKVANGARLQAAVKGNGDKIIRANFVPPKDIGKG